MGGGRVNMLSNRQPACIMLRTPLFSVGGVTLTTTPTAESRGVFLWKR